MDGVLSLGIACCSLGSQQCLPLPSLLVDREARQGPVLVLAVVQSNQFLLLFSSQNVH
jgi:hypothetical protein